MLLDIACGQNKREGFVGIDIANVEGVDIVHDLNVYPWPIEDNSVDEVWCSHYIEHVPDLFKFIDEIYRIMKIGAKATFISPYYSSVRAWQDPTHVRAISEWTYYYFNQQWREVNKLTHYPVKADFDIVNFGHAWNQNWVNRSQDAKAFALQHYINVVDDIWGIIQKNR
jgi:predicted SAM-dependent methyltransferase